MSIRFYCMTSKKRPDGKAPIEMIINLDGKRLVTHLPRKEKPEDFDRQMKSKRTSPLKEYLITIETRLREYETACIREGEQLTLEGIKEFIEDGYTRKVPSVQTLLDDFLSSIRQKRDCGALTPKRYRKYEIALGYFMEGTGIKPTYPISCIRNKTIQDFKNYLTGRNFEPVTIAGFLQCVKSFILYGIRNGIIKDNPFAGIKIGRYTKKVQFLTEEEVKRIKEKPMYNDRLDRVRDLFLFQCYTALSYCDMALLEERDFLSGKDGVRYIEKKRKKTGVKFLIVLLPEALTIARKYDFRLPVISNQRYNSYLKEIATLCSIEKNLHSHIGRHTAATFMLNRGVPMEIVAKVLGHSTTAQTRHYAKLLDDTVFREFKRLEQLL